MPVDVRELCPCTGAIDLFDCSQRTYLEIVRRRHDSWNDLPVPAVSETQACLEWHSTHWHSRARHSLQWVGRAPYGI